MVLGQLLFFESSQEVSEVQPGRRTTNDKGTKEEAPWRGASTHLLRLRHVFQDGVHAPDVEANPGVGVLDGSEGIQGSLPVFLVGCQYPFIPEADGLGQGHGQAQAWGPGGCQDPERG